MANRKYISLGMQCTTSAILDKLNIRKESYPFDWALTHLKFIFLFIKELYETDDTDYLCDFVIDIKNDNVSANYTGIPEKYLIVENKKPKTIYNRKHKIIFPHNSYNEDEIAKFKRRILRFKQNIQNKENKIIFFYVSPPNTDSFLLINEENVLLKNTVYLNKIAYFLEKKGVDFQIIYIDALNESTQLHSKITKINVPSFANGGDMANWCGDNLQLNI